MTNDPAIRIETHDDDSVTVTVGDVTARITAPSWREANNAAHMLGEAIRLRVDTRAACRRLASIRAAVQSMGESVDAMSRRLRDLSDA